MAGHWRPGRPARARGCGALVGRSTKQGAAASHISEPEPNPVSGPGNVVGGAGEISFPLLGYAAGGGRSARRFIFALDRGPQ